MKPVIAVFILSGVVWMSCTPPSVWARCQEESPATNNTVESGKENVESTSELKQATGKDPNASKVSTVGFPKLIFQHVIPGSKVIAKPIADRSQPMVIRIIETYPHGSDFRYDIEYKGLEPGNYDLAEYLQREDGSDVPIESLDVVVESLLGPGQVMPYELPPVESRYRSYYLPALLLGGTAWLIGLLMILFYGRGKNKRHTKQEQQLTVADRLRPLVDAAIAGDLDSQKQAELERVLSAFWSKKLRLSHLPASDLREKLRNHPEASVMLTQLDSWLHRPASDPKNHVDVNEILKPYQTMNYEEV